MGKWVVKGHYTALMSEDVIVCILTSPRIIAVLSDKLLHIPHLPWLTLPAVPLLCVSMSSERNLFQWMTLLHMLHHKNHLNSAHITLEFSAHHSSGCHFRGMDP